MSEEYFVICPNCRSPVEKLKDEYNCYDCYDPDVVEEPESASPPPSANIKDDELPF
jgi:hypothetical protein